MSRVIKFRAWVKSGDYSEMMPNVQNHIGAATGFGHLLQGTAKGIDESHVMQFTGLTDKNGVEIYEGDILQDSSLSNEDYENGEFYRGQVVFRESSFLQSYTKTLYEQIGAFDVVIGNIYQNPELLENKND